MKKFTIYLIAGLFAYGPLAAQYVGGGVPTAAEIRKARKSEPWRSRFYLYAGPSIPLGMWGREPTGSGTLTDAYLNNIGFGAKTGLYTEMGSIFYLRKIMMPDQMGVAINVTYLNFTMNGFTWERLGGQFTSADYSPFLSIGWKIGGLFTYNVLDKLNVDGYMNLVPSFNAVGEVYSGATGSYRYSVAGYTSNGISIRKNIGVNVRYSVLTFGVDVLFGKIKTEVDNEIHDYYSSSNYNTILDHNFTTNFKATALQLKFGFTF
jgi:hypothetical protein